MVAANFASEALNGGQVQLPKLRTNGTFDLHKDLKFIFDLVSISIKSICDGTSSPSATWND